MDDRKIRLKDKVISGLFWRLLERFGMQAMTFAISVVLARLLGPEAYGLVALVSIFVTISTILVDCGFGRAIIQKNELNPDTCSTVFTANLSIAAATYAVLWVASPAIARFYGHPVLSPLLRVLSLTLVFNAINEVQSALLEREMRFKISFKISLVCTILHGTVAIPMALCGVGVWTLVLAPIPGHLVRTAMLWSLVRWRPKAVFRKAEFFELFSFGWKLALASLINSAYTNVAGLIIGKDYSPVDLAFYNKGRSFPKLAVDSIMSTVSSVSFPALSALQGNKDSFKKSMRDLLCGVSFLAIPAMALLCGMAKPLVVLLLGEKWTPCVPYLQIACATFALQPVTTINLQAINALGRSGLTLKLEIVKKSIAFSVLFAAIPHGVLAFAAAGAFVTTPVAIALNMSPNKKLIGYSIRDQICDLLPAIAVSAIVAGTSVAMAESIHDAPVKLLCLQATAATALYIWFGTAFKPRGWTIAENAIRQFAEKFVKYGTGPS